MSAPVHPGLSRVSRLAFALLVLAPLALAVPALVDVGGDGGSEEPAAPRPPRDAETRLTIAEARPITGFAISAHHISDLSLYLESVDRIADMGANALIVLTPMFQQRVDLNEIRFVPEKCATDAQLLALLRRGRERGLFTALLPIILLEQPDERDWRGVIQPRDWDKWWASYDGFLDRFTSIANEAVVDLLVIGSELNSTEGQLERWARAAERVRGRFAGQIGYAANWDRYAEVKLWPHVDVMCVSAYFELERDDPAAPESKLVAAWTPKRDAMVSFARERDRPLLLVEIGYPSTPWATARPWDYVSEKDARADHDAQARGWRAFFAAWRGAFADPSNPAAGFFGYHWSPYYRGDAWDTGYGVQGKPAYRVIRNGMVAIRAAAADAP